MKSELERILNSDLAEYKIAVSDHISSLEHFEECLTERSTFMQNFNQMVKRELDRLNKDPTSDFQPATHTERLQSLGIFTAEKKQQSQGRLNDSFEEVYIEQKSPLVLARAAGNTHIRRQLTHLRMLVQECKQLKSNIKKQISELGKQIYDENKKKLLQITALFNSQSRKDLATEYEGTIAKQQKQIQALRKYIVDIEMQKKQLQTAANDKKFQGQPAVPDSIQNYTYSSIQSIQSVRRSQNNWSSLYTPSSRTIPDSQPNNTFCLESETKFVTVNNEPQQKWTHFVCDLQSPVLKQVKRQNYGKENTPLLDKKSHAVNEPRMPYLLKRDPSQSNYDLPTLKYVSVAEPPTQQGFAVLRLGDQVVYKGMWKYRRFHGKGKLSMSGYSYEGDFANGLFHGRGTLRLEGGVEFFGQFAQNRASGEGRMKVNGKSVQGLWLDNKLSQRY